MVTASTAASAATRYIRSALGIDGPQRAFIAAHRRVGIDGDEQAIAARAGFCEVLGVAGMQQVEAAAGKSDAAASGVFGADPLVDFGVGEHFTLGVCRGQVGWHAAIIAWGRREPSGARSLAHLAWAKIKICRATTCHEAKSNFSRLLKKTEQGEQVIIMRDGRPVAKLVPFVEQPARQAQTGLGRGPGRGNRRLGEGDER